MPLRWRVCALVLRWCAGRGFRAAESCTSMLVSKSVEMIWKRKIISNIPAAACGKRVAGQLKGRK